MKMYYTIVRFFQGTFYAPTIWTKMSKSQKNIAARSKAYHICYSTSVVMKNDPAGYITMRGQTSWHEFGHFTLMMGAIAM